MHTDIFHQFGQESARLLHQTDPSFSLHGRSKEKVVISNHHGEKFILELTPFAAKAKPVDAQEFFSDVSNTATLMEAYHRARTQQVFENNLAEAMHHVSPFAQDFLQEILDHATQRLSDADARLIAAWVQELDIYTAVKAVESLLNSKADLALLRLARKRGWDIHFDHLAIRCGTRANHDAERIVQMLTEHHGYVAPQITSEAFYQFADGWNAYPLYKVLRNGQFLRLFIDQSDAHDKTQIIQHWNRVYGYTAHHLAIRATTRDASGLRVAVHLDDVMTALTQEGIAILTPTGHYTRELLLQVFTRPEREITVPDTIKRELGAIDANLPRMIENGKLLELVSRKELPPAQAEALFDLYGLTFDPGNPLHSAPIYHYFLPTQAAHVIRTSVET